MVIQGDTLRQGEKEDLQAEGKDKADKINIANA